MAVGVVTSTLVVAQDSVEPSASATDQLIAKLQARVELEADVSGEFEQKKYIDVLPNPLKSRGEFHYNLDEGLVWTTHEPIASQLLFDDQGIRQNVEGETVWRVNAQQPAVVTITQVLTGVLSADWPVLREYFSLDGEVTEDHWTLHLNPTDQSLGAIVESMTLRGNRQLQSLTMQEVNGDRTEISFRIQ